MVNRYAYTLNDPVNMWDPDGQQSLTSSWRMNQSNAHAQVRSQRSEIIGAAVSAIPSSRQQLTDFVDGVVTAGGEVIENTVSVNQNIEISVDTSDIVSNSETNISSHAHEAGSAAVAISELFIGRGKGTVDDVVTGAVQKFSD